MQPVPVPTSTTTGDAIPRRAFTASSTSISVSGRGESVSFVTLNSSDQNSARPSMCAIGSRRSRRATTASKRALSSSESARCGSSARRARVTPSTCARSSAASRSGLDTPAAASRSRAARSAPRTVIALFRPRGLHRLDQPLQLLLALGETELLVELLDAARHHLVEVEEAVLDAVVGRAVLREVVGADLRAAVAAADHALARRRALRVDLALEVVEEARREDLPRAGAVLVLALLVLHVDADAGRQVREADRALGLVHLLAAGAARAHLVLAHVLVPVDLDVDLLRLGQHGDGRGRRVDAALRLGLGHALHAVHAALEPQEVVRAVARHLRHDLLEAALLGGALVEHLDLQLVLAAVVRIHVEEVAREDAGLVAADARADLEDDVAVAQLVAVGERALGLAPELGEPRLDVADLGLRELGHLGVARRDHLLRVGDRLLHGRDLAVDARDLAQRAHLAGDHADLVVVHDDGRVLEHPRQLGVARCLDAERPQQDVAVDHGRSLETKSPAGRWAPRGSSSGS